MLIKYIAPDPRAGMVVNMDSSLGQKMVDEKRAVLHKEGEQDAKAAEPHPNKMMPPLQNKDIGHK